MPYKTLQDLRHVRTNNSQLTSRFQHATRMLLSMMAYHVGHHLELFIRLAMIQPPLQEGVGQKDNGKPLFHCLV